MIQKVLDYLSRNRKVLITVAAILAILFLYNSIVPQYRSTRKQLKELQTQIKKGEDSIKLIATERSKLQDSINQYESVARRYGQVVKGLEVKVKAEQKAKEEALAKLKNLPVKVIDSILNARYVDIPKAGIDLSVDKNVGNVIVEELVEKDYLADHVVTISVLNGALKGQVVSLEKSLDLTKSALYLADSTTAIRTRQYQQSQRSIDLLKSDLKVAKKKAFWNQWKGVGAGVAAGLVIAILAK